MELLAILRVLWRHRLAVALGACLALLVGAAAVYEVSLSPPGLRSRATYVAHAQERVLVDTPKSLVADARAPGVVSIGTRTLLLADLMASQGASAEIARGAGLAPAEVSVVATGAAAPLLRTPLAEQTVEAVQVQTPYVVRIGEGSTLPILSIYVTAPHPERARRLADATVAALSAAAARPQLFGGRVVVEQLGRTQVGGATSGPSKAKAALAALVFFAFWCCAVVILAGLARAGRAAAGSLPAGAGASR